jgi:hypothetical protein
VHTRFKPGQSGNPRGRRKGQRNVSTVLAETLNQRIRIREGDRTRSLTKLDVWITIKNEAKAHAALRAAYFRSQKKLRSALEKAVPGVGELDKPRGHGDFGQPTASGYASHFTTGLNRQNPVGSIATITSVFADSSPITFTLPRSARSFP